MKQRLDIIIQYLQKNYLSYWLVLGCDTLTVFIATWASYVIVHYITETPVNFAVMCKILSVSVISGGSSTLLLA